MPFVRLQVTIPMDSGIPADSVVMTTHWVGNTGAESLGAVSVSAAANFENFLDGAKSMFSTDCNLAGITYKTFNLLDPEPRIPVNEGSLTVGTPSPGAVDLPAEVAIAVSFQAHPVSGLNQRRRRGRIYIGPLNVASGDWSRPPDAYVDALAQLAWENFVIPSPTDAVLAVFSGYTAANIPVGGTPGPDDDYVPELVPGSCARVDELWVDNAWDTQRRRGLAATRREAYA